MKKKVNCIIFGDFQATILTISLIFASASAMPQYNDPYGGGLEPLGGFGIGGNQYPIRDIENVDTVNPVGGGIVAVDSSYPVNGGFGSSGTNYPTGGGIGSVGINYPSNNGISGIYPSGSGIGNVENQYPIIEGIGSHTGYDRK